MMKFLSWQLVLSTTLLIPLLLAILSLFAGLQQQVPEFEAFGEDETGG